MLKTKITPLYERLSRDDELNGDSFSIQNQNEICQGYFHQNVLFLRTIVAMIKSSGLCHFEWHNPLLFLLLLLKHGYMMHFKISIDNHFL